MCADRWSFYKEEINGECPDCGTETVDGQDAFGCTTRTDYGECIGIADDKDPTFVYKVSRWNVILGVIFVEMIVPPVIVLANEFSCPVGKKQN